MQRFLVLFMVMFMLSPVHAQLPDGFVDDGEPLKPASERGRYTKQQGAVLALRAVPGEIVAMDSYKLGGNRTCKTVVVDSGGDFDIDDRQNLSDKVTEKVCRRSQSRTYYEYKILVPDGSVYEVEISTSTGRVHEIEVEHLSDNPVFPFEVIPEADMRATALAKVDEEEWGGRVPKVLDTNIEVLKRGVVYVLDIRKSPNKARVTIDARTGAVLGYETL